MFNKIKATIYRHVIYHKLGQLWMWQMKRKDAESILKKMAESTCFIQCGKTRATDIVFTYHLISADKAYKKVLALTKDIEAKYSCLSRNEKARIARCILSTIDGEHKNEL
jgi:hypothetical protein